MMSWRRFFSCLYSWLYIVSLLLIVAFPVAMTLAKPILPAMQLITSFTFFSIISLILIAFSAWVCYRGICHYPCRSLA